MINPAEMSFGNYQLNQLGADFGGNQPHQAHLVGSSRSRGSNEKNIFFNLLQGAGDRMQQMSSDRKAG